MKKLKRIAIAVVLGVALFSVRGSRVEAHYIGWQNQNGTLVHVTSFEWRRLYKVVGNLEKEPAELVLTAEILESDLLCGNPGNAQSVVPGKAGITFVVGDLFGAGDLVGKGKAFKTILIDDSAPGSPLMDSSLCVNPNWIALDVITRLVRITASTYELDDQGNRGDLAFTETLLCLLSSEVDFDFPLGQEYPFQCTVENQQHVK